MTNTKTMTKHTGHSFRALMVLLATTLALAALMALGASAEKAEAGTAAVTKTFSNIAQIKVPSGAVVGNCSTGPTQGAAIPYPSRIPLSLSNGFPQGSRIQDVNLTLKGFTHTFPDDVDMVLVHTKGTSTRNATLMSDAGGSTDVNGATITLDDEAGATADKTLPDNGPLVSGTYRTGNYEGASDNFPAPAPDNTTREVSPFLSAFDGQKANGDWNLYVMDDAGGDCGILAGGYSLTIKAR
jgi:hypothetical protein